MKKMDDYKLSLITAKSQSDKAINSLKGILIGIDLDNKVNENELNELYNWTIFHNDLINKHPFNEIMNNVENLMSENLQFNEVINDILWLCEKYEGYTTYYDKVTSDLQILQGICHGILADGIITDDEVINLHLWLSDNDHLNSFYPYDEIRSLVLTIISDKQINEDEKTQLKAFISQFVDIKDRNINDKIKTDISNVELSGLCTSEPEVIFYKKKFCITGIIKRGNRETIKNEIIKLGGIFSENVTANLDYLIVGDNGNPAWVFSCYGRKVEKVINLRKEGAQIMIIHEFDFSDILDDLI